MGRGKSEHSSTGWGGGRVSTAAEDGEGKGESTGGSGWGDPSEQSKITTDYQKKHKSFRGRNEWRALTALLTNYFYS